MIEDEKGDLSWGICRGGCYRNAGACRQRAQFAAEVAAQNALLAQKREQLQLLEAALTEGRSEGAVLDAAPKVCTIGNRWDFACIGMCVIQIQRSSKFFKTIIKSGEYFPLCLDGIVN